MTPGVDDAILARAREAADRPGAGAVVVGAAGIAARLRAEGVEVRDGPLGEQPRGRAAAVLLTDDELSRAGERAEHVVDDAAGALQPDGLLVATVRNGVFARHAAVPLEGLRGFDPTDLDRLVGHRGFSVDLLAAPGAAARLRASVDPDTHHEPVFGLPADREPALLGAAPSLLLAARAPRDAQDREQRYFGTLPRKVIAAGVICRADDGRMLLVHDRFKGHWTIPGGVSDPQEPPREAAEREAWEETGIRVAAGAILGLFAGAWPDRLVCVYDGVPVGGGAPAGNPVHAHEIDDVAWVAVPEALERLGSDPAYQVRRCLTEPGGTWRLPEA